MKEENLLIYNQVKEVPERAKKTIQAGRLKGMTDIKPMWRIEKLTEVFGICGFGWKTKTLRKEIIEGANEEKIAVVDIELYVRVNGEWSEPIEGSGGSSFISKESKGLYTSDECFKMAYTDALSVACKSLGIGADVYWGDSKDTKNSKPADNKPVNNTSPEEKKATPGQIKVLERTYTGDNMKKLLMANKIDKIEDMPLAKASEIIKKIAEKAVINKKEGE